MFHGKGFGPLGGGRVPVRRGIEFIARRRAHASTGFVPVRPRLHRFYNLGLGLLLLLVSLPLLAVLTAAVFATQGWRVFYAGPRIGLDGRTYNIFKFRTLDGRRAREITQDRVLPADSGIETPMGAFLRDTRLDELPQLLNVVLGDMNVCGPRPVRPQMAIVQRLEIPEYDIRFSVKPGLIGHTQAYMHHGTSKALRARYNRVLCHAPVRYRGELGMIGLVGACVVARTLSKLWEVAAERLLGQGRAFREQAAARTLSLHFVDAGGKRHRVVQVSRTHVVFDRPSHLGSEVVGDLVITLPSSQRRRARVALTSLGGDGHVYVPTSDYAHHVVSRYLWQAVVVPHRSHFWGAVLARTLRGVSLPFWSDHRPLSRETNR